MRLIRLVSPNQEAIGEFENLFSSDIKVKHKSKIGLLSASLPLSLKKIIIDANTNTIGFRTSGRSLTPVSYAVLTNGYYTNGELLTELNKQLNYALLITRPSDIGFQWNCQLDSTNHLNIQYRRASYQVWNPPARNENNMDNTAAAGTFTPAVAPVGYNTYIYTSRDLINSCGIFRCTVRNTGSFIMGLFQNREDPTLLSPTDFYYGIGINNGKYSYLYNNVQTDYTPNTAPLLNDVVSIELSGGEILLNVYRANNLLINLGAYPLDNTESYKTGISLIQPASSVNNVRWNPDPRQTETLTGVTMETYNELDTENNVDDFILNFADEPTVGAIPGPPNNPGARWVLLRFSTIDIRNALGFSKSIHRTQLNRHTFKGNNSLDSSNTPNSVVIELPSLSLDSYDGKTSQRKNIIAVIPTLNQVNNRLTFYAQNPIMLDMNNDHEFNIRKISCRILDLDDAVLLLEQPGAEITLLIS